MNIRLLCWLLTGMLGVGVFLGCDDDNISHPPINPADFSANVTNPYFPLVPGRTLWYTNTITEDSTVTVQEDAMTTTQEIKTILGVPCRVVHDVVTEDGVVVEDTFDWYSQDSAGNVWYFGEDTTAFNEDGSTSKEGSWEAGVNGAEPGIIMFADPAAHIGEVYRQEFSPGVAEDQARILAVGVTADTPFATFENCVETEEFTDLEPGVVEHKFYASDVGEVRAETVQGGDEVEVLVNITDE